MDVDMTPEGAALLPETHPLALFLGDGPRLVLGRPGDHTGVLARVDLAEGALGSVLLLAGATVPRRGRHLVEFLAHCRRLVRPGGRIGVLGANRLPAAVQALRTALALRSRVQRTHDAVGSMGPRQVVSGLRAAGWEDVSLLSVAPSANDPAVMTPLHGSLGWGGPALLVTAASGTDARPSLLGAMLAALGEACPGPQPGPRPELVQVTNSERGKSVAIASRGTERFVVRIARSPAMLEDEARSFAVLLRLQSNAGVAGRVPRPLLDGAAGGLRYFVQSHLQGSPLTRVLDAASREAYLKEAEAFLRELNPGPPEASPIAVDTLQGAWVGQPMVPFVLQHIEDASLRAKTRALLDETLRGASSRVGIVHGDFGTGNILVEGGRLTGVIAWEASHDRGLPVLDAFNYLDATHRFCSKGPDIVDTLPMLARGEWPVRGEIEFLRRSFERCGVDFRFRAGLALLYFFFHIGPQLRFVATEGGPKVRLERMVRAMVRN